jgi:hypothetical protein
LASSPFCLLALSTVCDERAIGQGERVSV